MSAPEFRFRPGREVSTTNRIGEALSERIRQLYERDQLHRYSREEAVCRLNRHLPDEEKLKSAPFDLFVRTQADLCSARQLRYLQTQKWRGGHASCRTMLQVSETTIFPGGGSPASTNATTSSPGNSSTRSSSAPTAELEALRTSDVDEATPSTDISYTTSVNGVDFEMADANAAENTSDRQIHGQPLDEWATPAPTTWYIDSIYRRADMSRSSWAISRCKSKSPSSCATTLSSIRSKASSSELAFEEQGLEFWKLGRIFAARVRTDMKSSGFAFYDEDDPFSSRNLLATWHFAVLTTNETFSWCALLSSGSSPSQVFRTCKPKAESTFRVCLHETDASLGHLDPSSIHLRRNRAALRYQDVPEFVDFGKVIKVRHKVKIVPIASVIDLENTGTFLEGCRMYGWPMVVEKMRRRQESSHPVQAVA
jgi:hypothetical protein